MTKPSAKRAILTSFIVDLGDIALNVAAMLITGSVVLLAEAFEGGSDLVASGLLFIGLRISKRRANRSHPFGYGKALFSWTLLSACVMLVFGGGLSFYYGLQRFLEPHGIEYLPVAYVTLFISICTNGYGTSVSVRRLLDGRPWRELWGLLVDSDKVETKNTFILDVTGTTAALVGVISLVLYQVTGLQFLDGLGSMLMGVIIAVSAVALIWGVKEFLSGKSGPVDVEKRIRDAALERKQVKAITELSTMYLGSTRLLVHLDIEVEPSTTVEGLRALVADLKERIRKAIPLDSTIQIEIAGT